MSVAAKSEICSLALQFYKDEMEHRQLSESDLERLTRAANRPSTAIDKSGWGALQPEKDKVDATCGLIDWAVESVAKFWKFRHIRNPLTKPEFLFVGSQYISFVLDGYRKAGSPETYSIPESDYLKIDGLGDFVANEPGKRLLDMPHWEQIAFLLHSNHHWSVLVYVRSINRLVHWDSLGKIHEDVMWEMCDFLHATGLVDRDVEPGVPNSQGQQKGVWQCGYAVIARLLGCRLAEFDADNVIENRMPLFLNYLLLQNDGAKKKQLLLRRWNRY